MKNIIKKPEILSPVGKTENLYAAIEAGADSVYLGYKSLMLEEMQVTLV